VSFGDVKVSGTIAYVSQEAWIFNGTVKENILLGKPYNFPWYQKVVEMCALQKDFDMLSYGDKTIVGDKGRSLSGGQKARINLARLDTLVTSFQD
jgi:ATP-binding cassette subfamily C (CFTR/MRP) protein 4